MHNIASRFGCLVGLLAVAIMPAASRAQSPASPSWTAVDDALGRTGSAQPGGVMKYSFPRSDLVVTVAGVTLKPALALGSWAAFRMIDASRAMLTGDLVLLESEVDPVMRALQAGGVEQTALHNHVLAESPHVMYMHIMGEGAPATLATTLRDALAKSATPLGAPAAAGSPVPSDLDTAAVAKALGVSGKLNGVVYQVSVPRSERILEHGHEITPAMGVATAINFQPTGAGRAAVTGDFVLLATEVNPVIRALTSHGIAVTAVHSHMLTETPRLFFMHFWANADAVTLAQGLHAALSVTRSRM